MKGQFSLSFLLVALIPLVYSYDSFAPPEHCTYDYLCRRETGTPVPDFSGAAEECQDACKADADDSGTCVHWTFERLGSQSNCFLLADPCIEESLCSHPANCASGPSECAKEDCAQLVYTPGVNTALWSCLYGPSSPYSNPIPTGSECSVSCPTWTTETVKATCDNGGWTVDPTGISDSTPTEITSPADLPNPTCTCNQITIPKDVLEHEENGGGAELYCDIGEGGGYVLQEHDKEIVIETNWHCVFLCDRHPILDFSCFNGVWSDGVEDCTSIYCYDKPSNEKCGMESGPTTPEVGPTTPEVTTPTIPSA